MDDGSVILVTTDKVPGYRIVRVLGLVSGSSAMARGLGGDILASIRNLVGGEVTEYTELMEAARKKALQRLIENARRRGANAVVGLKALDECNSTGSERNCMVWYCGRY